MIKFEVIAEFISLISLFFYFILLVYFNFITFCKKKKITEQERNKRLCQIWTYLWLNIKAKVIIILSDKSVSLLLAITFFTPSVCLVHFILYSEAW